MSAVLPSGIQTDRDVLAAKTQLDARLLPVPVPAVPDTRSAQEKLEASRAALRTAMLEIVNPPKRAGASTAFSGDLLQSLLAKAKTLPGASIVIDSVENWWSQHPLHTAGVIAGGASKAFLQPIAKRSPQTLIFGAAAAGALVALTRPWRWLIRPALFFGLLPQLVSQVLKHMPLSAWLRMATTMVKPAKPERASTTRPQREAAVARSQAMR